MNTEAEAKRGQEEMEGFRAALKARSWFEEVAVKTLSRYSAALLPFHMPSQLQTGATSIFFMRAYCKMLCLFSRKNLKGNKLGGFFPSFKAD